MKSVRDGDVSTELRVFFTILQLFHEFISVLYLRKYLNTAKSVL